MGDFYDHPASCNYVIDGINDWMEDLGIEESEIEMIVGPRTDRESGDYIMDVYAKYTGPGRKQITWDVKIDYSSWDPSFEEILDDYRLWIETLDEELSDAEIHYAKIAGVNENR